MEETIYSYFPPSETIHDDEDMSDENSDSADSNDDEINICCTLQPSARRLCKSLSTAVILTALVLGYVVLGGFLFEYLERDHDNQQFEELNGTRKKCLQNLWRITEQLNVLYEKNWSRLIHEELIKFESLVVSASLANPNLLKEEETYQSWSFSSSLFYSITLITTIGYERMTPRTSSGKIAVILYAIFGVPLMLLYLSCIGHLLAKFIQCLCCMKQRNDFERLHIPERSDQNIYCNKAKNRGLHEAPYQSFPLQNLNVRGKRRKNSHGENDRNKLITCENCKNETTPVHHFHCPHNSIVRNSPKIHFKKFEAKNSSSETEDDLADNGECSRLRNRQTLSYKRAYKNVESLFEQTQNHQQKIITSMKNDFMILFIFITLSSYLCIGAGILAHWENWSFIDCLFLCFSILTTIGFGNTTPVRYDEKNLNRTYSNPLVKLDEITNDQNILYGIYSCYILVGLILVSIFFKLLKNKTS